MIIRTKNGDLIRTEQERLDACLRKFKEAYKKGRAQAVAYLCRVFAIDIIPTPVVEFAKELGFTIIRKNLKEPISGFIMIDSKLQDTYDTDSIIWINGNFPVTQQRFSIAHEIAHYIFDYDMIHNQVYYQTHMPNGRTEDMEEIRADEFAAELLMPTKAFSREYHKLPKRLSQYDHVQRLSELFGVSRHAIRHRILDLDLS